VGQLWRTYYYAGGQRIAVRERTATTDKLTYLHGDHLGSASLATDASGGVLSEMRYTPYGETRSGDMATDRRYTGQRWEDGIGLYDYNARYYDPVLGRFISADTIVPEPGNPQSLNRYAYVLNNPLKTTKKHSVVEGPSPCPYLWPGVSDF
jgi:RHS repeat-associated protein